MATSDWELYSEAPSLQEAQKLVNRGVSTCRYSMSCKLPSDKFAYAGGLVGYLYCPAHKYPGSDSNRYTHHRLFREITISGRTKG